MTKYLALNPDDPEAKVEASRVDHVQEVTVEVQRANHVLEAEVEV